jgi:SPP1 family predicted phage head-tail adaptor
MKAGRLRDRISFQRLANNQNDYNESKGVWTALTETWAAVEPLGGREFFSAQQVQSDITTRIVCRYASALADVTPKDRIQHGTVYYDIRSVIDVDSRHRELQFMCTQRVD